MKKYNIEKEMNRTVHTTICFALLMIFCAGSSVAQNRQAFKVIPAKKAGKVVSSKVMNEIYEKIKTPFKYGVILKEQGPAMVDTPSVFRHGDKWYMMYVIFDGKGYETAIAESDDLLNWKKLGTILAFSKDTWDANQAAGYIALQDYKWNGSYKLNKHDDKYWLSYIGGDAAGYERGHLKIGLANTSNPTVAKPWTRISKPVLGPEDPDVRMFEGVKLYKSHIIHDKSQSLGFPYVMYYNAAGGGRESIGMAVSKDMTTWLRYGKDPVVDHGKGIAGDPQITKIGDVWVMFYFGAYWKPPVGRGKGFERFACSYDMVNWTTWQGANLIEPSEPWDRKFAHKPWVVTHNGVVYHFYCAVGNQGRTIAVATSKDLKPQDKNQK
jgi:predicted GH43/DUF377 family glycosyl hydrolase